MVNLTGKKILLMGASGGVGKATAIVLSKLGASVILSGRNKDKLDELLTLLEGNNHHLVEFDIQNLDSIETFLQRIKDLDNKKLDGLVYSAGLIPIRPIKNTTSTFLDEIMRVNYYGFAEMVRCFSNKKISKGGSIVALSSYAAINGDKGQLAYAASKGAIDSSVVVMAKELYSKNIRVNALRPANIAYENMDNDSLLDGTKEITQKMQTGAINPINIAEQIAFLLSDCSSGVYGRCFDIRGYMS